MRIAMVTGEYPPHQGGIGDYTLALSEAMQDADHEVSVFTAINASDLAQDIPIEVPVKNLKQQWRLWDIPGLVSALRDFKPDVVNIQYEPAAYAMRLGIYALPHLLRKVSIPTIVTWHDILPPYLFPKAGTLRDRIVERLAHKAQGNIFTNTSDQDILTNRCRPRDILDMTTVIPIGSNIAVAPTAGFSRESWRQQHGYPPDSTIIGFFGFRNRTKGLEYLIDALAILRQQDTDVHLLFIGGETGTSDPSNVAYAEEINTRITKRGLQSYVKTTGFAPQVEVSAALLGIDICALPFVEGANLRHGTLHAALAHGCAIITTYPHDGKSALNDAQVVLIEAGNVNALSQAIKALVDAPDARRAYSAQAQAYSEQFRWPAIAQHTVEFYDLVLNNLTQSPT